MRRLPVVVLLLLLWAPAARAWTWPVRGPVVQSFSFDKAHPYAAGQHRGVDIGSSVGVAVLAPSSGTVTFAGSVPGNGTTVTIETSGGLAVTVTHLGSVSVERGATIAEGAAIGTVGPSGTPEVDGPYVHLGIRVASDENGYLDPLSLLPPADTVGSPDPTPSPGQAPAPQQSSAASAPSAASGSTKPTASSGTAPPAGPGPPATGVSAPVEVPATDFAAHSVAASAKPAPSPVARAVPTTAASVASGRRAVPVTVPPVRASRVVHAGGRVGQARVRRSPRARASTRAVTASATQSVTRSSATRSPRALRAAGASEVVVAVRRRPLPAPSTARATRSAKQAAGSSLLSPAPLAGAVLAPLLLLLGALFRRQRVAPAAPPLQDAIVLALPLPPRHEHLREHEQLAA